MDRAAMFRSAAAEHNRHRSGPGWRYPEELKKLAVDFTAIQK